MNQMHLSPQSIHWRIIAASFVGGLVGSAARASCEWGCVSVGLPAWTARMAVNVIGAFAIGILFARLCDCDTRGVPLGVPPHNRLREHLLGAGFLGGFTTVSGFAGDMVFALQERAFERAVVMFAADAVLGIAAVALGYSMSIARRPNRSITRDALSKF